MISMTTAISLMAASSLFTAGAMWLIDREQLRMTRWTRDLALALDQRASRGCEQVRRLYASDGGRIEPVIDEPTGSLPIVQPRQPIHRRAAAYVRKHLVARDRRDYQPRHRRHTQPARPALLPAGILPAARRIA